MLEQATTSGDAQANRSRRPKVSVCLASHNGAQFIRRQLQSILIQLSSDDEVIVVDDASSDDTVAVVKSFSDARLKLFCGETHRGVVATFQLAFTHVTGHVIFLSDQDDFWLPDKVDAMLDRLGRGSDLVVHDAVIVFNGEVVVPSVFKARRSGPGPWKNFVRNSYTGCCMAFRRGILAEVLPIPEGDRIYHDVWVGIATELSGYRVEFLDRVLIEYSRHGTNVTRRLPLRSALMNRLALLYGLSKLLLPRVMKRMRDGYGIARRLPGA